MRLVNRNGVGMFMANRYYRESTDWFDKYYHSADRALMTVERDASDDLIVDEDWLAHVLAELCE
jgi:hypothetical protein